MHVQSVVDQFAKQLYNALNVSKITIDGQHHKNKGNLGFFLQNEGMGTQNKINLKRSTSSDNTSPPFIKHDKGDLLVCTYALLIE